MTREIFQAFVKHASGGPDTPNDYQSTRAAVRQMFPKLAMGPGAMGVRIARGMESATPARAEKFISKMTDAAKRTQKPGSMARSVMYSTAAQAGEHWKPKLASAWEHAAELGGLGILAKPSIDHLRGKEQSEKSKALHETAGLGILAAPTAYKVGKPYVSKAITGAKKLFSGAAKPAANWATKTLHH